MRGLRLAEARRRLQRASPPSTANADFPLEIIVFCATRWGDLDAVHPVVERINSDGLTIVQEGTTVSERSVQAEWFGAS